MKHNTPLTDAQRAVVEEHLHLIAYALAKTPVYLFDSREDAFQIGAIGLMKAARGFDPTRNVLFSTYASHCIVNELLMAVRGILRAQSSGRACSLDAPVTLANGESVTLADTLCSNQPQPEAEALARESLEEIARRLRDMPDADAPRLIRLALQGRRQADMAALLGCTQSAVSRRLRRIRTALQKDPA